MFWYYILVAAFALVAFLCVKEWKRTNRSRLALRLVASLSAVLSIVILSYPDKKEPQQRQSSKVIVLTGGFNTDTLIRLLQKNKMDTRSRRFFFTTRKRFGVCAWKWIYK